MHWLGDVAVPLPKTYPTNRPTHTSNGTHTRLFTVGLLIIANYWKQPQAFSSGELAESNYAVVHCAVSRKTRRSLSPHVGKSLGCVEK